MLKPITSVRVRPTGGPHARVDLWVNHALAGALVMRVEEADEFKAGLERAGIAAVALHDLVDSLVDSEGDPFEEFTTEDWHRFARALKAACAVLGRKCGLGELEECGARASDSAASDDSDKENGS